MYSSTDLAFLAADALYRLTWAAHALPRRDSFHRSIRKTCCKRLSLPRLAVDEEGCAVRFVHIPPFLTRAHQLCHAILAKEDLE